MTIADYASLQNSISNWLKRTDLATNIPDFITLAEAKMNRAFIAFYPPLRAMENTATGNLTVTTTPPALLALPTGYIGTKRFQVQLAGNYFPLVYKTPEQMATYTCSSQPQYYTLNGEYLEIGAPPDTNYAYSWTYYKKIPPLSAGVNWVITNHPDIYLYGSLLQAEPFLKNDKRITTWLGFYTDAMKALDMANMVDRQSGSTLQARSDAAI